MRGRWLFPLLAALGCRTSSGVEPLERFAGEWRCPMTHLTVDGRVMQMVTIARDPKASRYAVRFSPDASEPSPDAVTSVAYWSYDGTQFVSDAKVGEGETAAEEHYTSPGPGADTLVWTGELRSAISAPMRMTFARRPAGLEILVEAFADHAWKRLSTASCTPGAMASRPAPVRQVAARVRAEPAVRDHADRSPFVDGASDRFAYKAVQATDAERRMADEAADQAQAAIDQAVELSLESAIEKSEAVRRIQRAYADRDRALDRIFGEERAGVLRDIHVSEGIEVREDTDPD